MAKANHKKLGPGAQERKSGTGAMTDMPEDMVEDHMILSNRDKSRHSGDRGADGKWIQQEQEVETEAARAGDPPKQEPGP